MIEFYISGAWTQVSTTSQTLTLSGWIAWLNIACASEIGDYAEFLGTTTLEYIYFVTDESLVTKMRFLNQTLAEIMGFAYNTELVDDGYVSAYPFSNQALLWGKSRLILQASYQTRDSVLAECDLDESPYKSDEKVIVGYGYISSYSLRKDPRTWTAHSVYVDETRKIDIRSFRDENCKGIHQSVLSFGIAKTNGVTLQVGFSRGQQLKTTYSQGQLADFKVSLMEVL